jgi:hypothetical protein
MGECVFQRKNKGGQDFHGEGIEGILSGLTKGQGQMKKSETKFQIGRQE